MWGEGRTLVVTMVGGALITVLLGWTLVVYTSGGGKRRRLDPLIVGLLVLSALRQAALVGRAAVRLFRPNHALAHYCSLIVWSASSVSVLQGALAATLGLCLVARCAPKYSRLVTRSHLSYHLVSASLLSSCVGVAAVLARRSPSDCLETSSQTDPRYSLFALTLQTALTLISLSGLLSSFCLPRSLPSISSTSDLSSSSLSSGRTLSDASSRARQYLVSQLLGTPTKPDYDPSYMSTTSSTNSKAFLARPRPVHDVSRFACVSLLLVSLATNHIPLLVVMAGTELWGWSGWLFTQIPDWSTLAEGILLPLVLAITDRAFIERLSRVYTRPKPPDFSRPPQGPYGKFMPRSSIIQGPRDHHTPPLRFPITNGSLFASLDGRLPPIQRRFKGGGGRWQWMGCEEDPLYASLSAKSACSATTQANSDFEFFSNTDLTKTPHNKAIKNDVLNQEKPSSSGKERRRESQRERERPRTRPIGPIHNHNLVSVMSMDSLATAHHHKQDYRHRNKWESVPDLNRHIHYL